MARTPLLHTLRKFIRAARARHVGSSGQTSKYAVTRRDFLAGLGALSATAALPGMAHASDRKRRIARDLAATRRAPRRGAMSVELPGLAIASGYLPKHRALKEARHRERLKLVWNPLLHRRWKAM